jgi:hypothetical protein
VYFTGIITNFDEEQHFKVVANFCFDNNEAPALAGSILYQLRGTFPRSRVYMVAYSDEEDHFGAIFNSRTGQYYDMTCEEKVDFASAQVRARIGIEERVSIRQSLRPRFWYFAIACCGCSGEEGDTIEGIEYRVRMLNDQTGWNEKYWEFGYDEKGLQDMYTGLFVIYVFYIAVHFYAIRGLYSASGNIHGFVKLFSLVIIIEFVSIFFFMIHYNIYQDDGVGQITLRDLATLLSVISRISFMAILMFLAQGWTITTYTLSVGTKRAILGSLTFLCIFYLALLLWGWEARTPEMIKPVAIQQGLSWIIMLFFLLFAAWFGRCCYKSFKSLNPSDASQRPKRNLFMLLGFVFTCWIASLPVVELITTLYRPWLYAKANATWDLLITTLGYILFTAIIWPSHAAKYFGEPSRSAPSFSTLDHAVPSLLGEVEEYGRL